MTHYRMTPKPETSLKVRQAELQDSEAFLSLVQALADYENLPGPDEGARSRLLNDAFGDKPRFTLFLAEFEGQPIGYAVVFETYSTFLAMPTLYLEDLFVLPDHRKRGAGMALFKTVAQEAVWRGCGRLEWMVLDWNQIAIDFYERIGANRLADWLPYRLTPDQFQTIANEKPTE